MLAEVRSGIKKVNGQKNKDSLRRRMKFRCEDTDKFGDVEEGSGGNSFLIASMFSAVGGEIMC